MARDAVLAAPSEHLAMLVAYDGSRAQGWQVQRNGPSIQGRIEAALHTITRQPVKVYGSGRTDAGVHALGQVANFRAPVGTHEDALHALRARLNGLLAPDIVVKALVSVPAGFHARHKARGKVYRYRLFNRPHPPVFGRDHCWWIRRPLALDAMRAAAAHLVGEHDFSAFRAKDCEAPHSVRHLRRLELREAAEPDCTLALELEANGFLQHMARILTGTLVEVGLGKRSPDAMPALLTGARREDAAATAPPGGLHLVRVLYDFDAYPALRAFLDA